MRRMRKMSNEYVENLQEYITSEVDRISKTNNLIELNNTAKILQENIELFINAHRERIYKAIK